MFLPPPPPPPPSRPAPGSPEALELEIHELLAEHARLRSQLEERFGKLRQIEERFLALRPNADAASQKELKHRLILARPWRAELEAAYQELLVTANQLAAVSRRVHEVQLRAAQLAVGAGGPTPGGPGAPPPPG